MGGSLWIMRLRYKNYIVVMGEARRRLYLAFCGLPFIFLQIPIISWRIPCLFPKTFSKMAHMAESHFRGNIPDRFIGVFNKGSGFGEAVFHEVFVRGCLEA